MKKIITLLLTIFTALTVSAAPTDPVASGFVDTASITESRLSTLGNEVVVNIEDAPTLNSIGFAARFIFLDGVTSVTFSTASAVLKRRVNGVELAAVNIPIPRLNPEGDINKASVFAKDAAGNLIPMSPVNLVGATIPNPKNFYITEYNTALGNVNFPRPGRLGDSYEVIWTFTGSYVLNGTPVPFANVVASAKLTVFCDISGVLEMFTGTGAIQGESVTLAKSNLRASDYLKTYWIEVTEGDRMSFSSDFSVTDSGPNHIKVSFLKSHQKWSIMHR